MASSKRFEGKTAFITGAANAMAAEGARVVVTDRTEAALQETASHVRAAGAEVLAIACDVSKPEEIEAAVAQAVRAFGRIDCAFNNAGVENEATPLHEIELQEWDRILDINLRGTFVCMKHEIAQMVRQGGGVVVNTSSGAGIRGVAGGSAYAASKHAIIGMTKSAALDYAKQNIRVNAILPGNIATPMMDRFTGGDIKKAIDLEPVGRLGPWWTNRSPTAISRRWPISRPPSPSAANASAPTPSGPTPRSTGGPIQPSRSDQTDLV